MKLKSDLAEYKAATEALVALYDSIGSDATVARARRPERWAANARKREAAENVIMSILGEHRPALSRAGLERMYEEFAAGGGSDLLLYKIVDETVRSFGVSNEATP